LLLAHCIAGGQGSFGDHWNVLASSACGVGGNLSGRYNGRLFANPFENRTDHCVLAGPLFLIAAILLLSSVLTHIKPALIWIVVLVGAEIPSGGTLLRAVRYLGGFAPRSTARTFGGESETSSREITTAA